MSEQERRCGTCKTCCWWHADPCDRTPVAGICECEASAGVLTGSLYGCVHHKHLRRPSKEDGGVSDSKTRYEWMDGDSRDKIGGRLTDISNIPRCLYSRVREAYPINAVPQSVVELLNDAETICEWAENTIQRAIEAVSDDLAKKRTESQ
jgi:hypothetical protein